MLQLAMERASPEKQQREVIENAYISRRVGRIKDACYFNGIASDADGYVFTLQDTQKYRSQNYVHRLTWPSPKRFCHLGDIDKFFSKKILLLQALL